jgi:diadenosine tetraphosphate (Ap4A) HIT family hydrolase
MFTKKFLTETFNLARNGKPGCLFCQPYEGMILYETEHFRVLIDTFPVTSGHLMISSKDHFGCSGEIPKAIFGELNALKEDLFEKMISKFNRCLFYEHGRAGCCLSKSPNLKCEHFHLHCLPENISIQPELSCKFEEARLANYQQIPNHFLQYGDYLYFEDSLANKFYYPVDDHKIESHLLRSLICKKLKVPALSNWEDFVEPKLFLDSYHQVAEFYSEEQREALYDLHG